MEVLTVKLDASDALQAIRKAIEPGAVLLSVDALVALWEQHGVSAADLVALGGIQGTGADEVTQ